VSAFDDADAITEIRSAVYRLMVEHKITAPPVDVEALAWALGLEVLRTVSLPEACPAMLICHAEWPIIYVRTQDSRARQRFSIAHELYHYLFRSVARHQRFDYEKLGEPVPWEERAADRFAAELLMPDLWISYMARLGERLDDMPVIYAVSETAMHRRYAELGLKHHSYRWERRYGDGL
jgi:Zn-dependent peptidase ImmA (M78 family)